MVLVDSQWFSVLLSIGFRPFSMVFVGSCSFLVVLGAAQWFFMVVMGSQWFS